MKKVKEITRRAKNSKIADLENYSHLREQYVYPSGTGNAIGGDYHIRYNNEQGQEVCRFNNNTGRFTFVPERISQLPTELQREAIEQYLSIFPEDVREEMKSFIR